MIKYFTKTLFTNKSLWGWAVLFMGLWLFLGAYVFDSSGIVTKIEWETNTSFWFSIIGLISGSVIAVSISYSIYYSSSALAYGFRYTKLKPSGYMFSLLFGTGIVSASVGVIIMAMTFGMFSNKSGFFMIPKMPEVAIGIFFLSGMFFLLLSATLVLFVNNFLGLKNVTLVAFLPEILSFVFGLSQVGIQLPSTLVYAAPFSDIPRLLYLGWYGSPSYMGIVDSTGGYVNSYILLASLLAWISILFVIAMVLLKRIRSSSVEEGRQI